MRCVVLMSTYDGERFLREQLRSILDQLPMDGLIFIRDDGSRDATASVVRSFVDARIRFVVGQNVGFAQSFLELMKMAPRDADMYMLADQDDVWLPGKIDRAWSVVSGSGSSPFLYYSFTTLVDSSLRVIGVGRKLPSNGRLISALTDNQVTGCTAAMNAALLDLAIPADAVLGDIHFHDWWLFAVAAAFGGVFCDERSGVLYRQHAHNQVGAGVGLVKYFKMLRYLKRKNWLASMASQFHAFRVSYSHRLTAAQLSELDAVCDPVSGLRRFAMLCSPKLHRHNWGGELLLRALLAFDWRDSKAR